MIWLSRSTSVPSLVSVRLNGNGAPQGASQAIARVTPFPAQYAADLGGLTLTLAGRKEIANWAGASANDIVTFPVVGTPHGTVMRTPLPGPNGSYTHASATNADARTLVVLTISDQGSLSQLYAQVTPLPH